MDLDKEVAPYIRFTEYDARRPGTPHIQLRLEKGKPYGDMINTRITGFMRRVDDHGERCIIPGDVTSEIFSWPGCLLFQHTADGLRQVQLEEEEPRKVRRVFKIKKYTYFQELAPGDERQQKLNLPERYRLGMTRGETYELVWPGCEISLWGWGSFATDEGQELQDKYPSICVAGFRLTLPIAAKNPRVYNPQPYLPAERIPGAPVLRTVLFCREEVLTPNEYGYKHVNLDSDVVYDAPPGSRPITFCTRKFWWYDRLVRRRGDALDTFVPEEPCMAGFDFDDPVKDEAANVGQSGDFVSLQPGEAWKQSCSYEVYADGWSSDVEFPANDTLLPGDELSYCLMGNTVDWWDWGTKEDHADTVITLRKIQWSGESEDTKVNGGRPRIIVPRSNEVKLTVLPKSSEQAPVKLFT